MRGVPKFTQGPHFYVNLGGEVPKSISHRSSVRYSLRLTMAELSVSKLCEILTGEKFDEDVVESFRKNKIDGETFLELDHDDLKELGIIALGDRKKVKKLQQRLKVSSRVHLHSFNVLLQLVNDDTERTRHVAKGAAFSQGAGCMNT